jgi:hypothetical protein
MTMNYIYTSITRAYPANEWRPQTAATLAAAITQPAALRPMSLMQLFTAAAQAGATVAEFSAVWQYSEFVQRVETALTDGDLAGAQALLAVCPVEFTPTTLGTLAAVLAANTLRLVDVVAAEQSRPGAVVTAPAQIDADDVTAALTKAGYAWDDRNGEWVRA